MEIENRCELDITLESAGGGRTIALPPGATTLVQLDPATTQPAARGTARSISWWLPDAAWKSASAADSGSIGERAAGGINAAPRCAADASHAITRPRLSWATKRILTKADQALAHWRGRAGASSGSGHFLSHLDQVAAAGEAQLAASDDFRAVRARWRCLARQRDEIVQPGTARAGINTWFGVEYAEAVRRSGRSPPRC